MTGDDTTTSTPAKPELPAAQSTTPDPHA
jgi:hypothetical protein